PKPRRGARFVEKFLLPKRYYPNLRNISSHETYQVFFKSILNEYQLFSKNHEERKSFFGEAM
ncbi:MAG: hypothetical protein ACK4GN_15050, partial [Runella sp.]